MFLTSAVICLLIIYHIVEAESVHNKINPYIDADDEVYTPRIQEEPIQQQIGPQLPRNITQELSESMSCEEFVANATFDPLKVLDIEWKIWYIWNPQYEEPFNIRFSPATKLLVDRFKVELDKEMKKPVNWDEAVLFMETSVEFSGLLIKTSVDGIFDVVPSLAFEYYNLPALPFALKLIEPPGYLAIVNCKYRLAYALASVDKMPEFEMFEQESKKIGYRNNFGGTVIDPPVRYTHHIRHTDDQPETHDDDDEDFQLEYLNQYNSEMESRLM